jgi:hypothetical protein
MNGRLLLTLSAVIICDPVVAYAIITWLRKVPSPLRGERARVRDGIASVHGITPIFFVQFTKG